MKNIIPFLGVTSFLTCVATILITILFGFDSITTRIFLAAGFILFICFILDENTPEPYA